MLAAHTAPAWEVALQGLLLFGVVLFVMSELVLPTIRFVLRIGSVFMYPLRRFEGYEPEHRDPTRPRRADEMAAYIVVSERMKKFDRKRISKP